MRVSDLYQQVTDRIVFDLEQGVAPWVKPWKSGRANGVGIMPANAVTGRCYSGVNIPILWDAAERLGFTSNGWITYKQASDLGAHVRKGEKGVHVVFTKKVSVTDQGEDPADNGEDNTREVSMLRAYTVFNVQQIEGLPERIAMPPRPYTCEGTDRLKEVHRLQEMAGIKVEFGGDKACFIPSKDFISMPPVKAFETMEHFAATLLHEFVHWSGHKDRLHRDLSGRFGSEAYAAEELIAELGAAFLCAQLNLEGKLRHSEYIASWLKVLKEDNRAIFTAASAASRASDFLLNYLTVAREVDNAVHAA